MAADIRTFWSTLLSVLLKCIAALGFTPARATAARTAPQTTAPVAGRRDVPAGVAAGGPGDPGTGDPRNGALRPGDLRATDTTPTAPTAPAARRANVHIPAPRTHESLPVPVPRRRIRPLTLPPTMKQRISAEAHGSSPSARSLRDGTGQPEDENAPCV